MKRLMVILAALALAVSNSAAPKKKKPPTQPPPPATATLNGAYWTFLFSYISQVPAPAPSLQNPINLTGVPGWYFPVPRSDATPESCWTSLWMCPQVDYVLTPHTVPITASVLRIKVQVVVTGDSPVFGYQTEPNNTCTTPAHVRAIIWDKTGSGMTEFGRWWSNPVAVQLSAATGTVTVDIPIRPDQWSSVYGKRGNATPEALAGWTWAFANPGRVGLTFGGGCFFGHGVYVSGGSADFRLLEFRFL